MVSSLVSLTQHFRDNKMAKVTLVLALFCFVAATNAQGFFGPGFGPSVGMAQAQFYQNFIIQQAANKLSTADLPEDLQMQVATVLANAESGFTACDDLLTTSPAFWQYKKCSAFQLKNVLNQLSAIEREATLRASSTTPAEAQ